jgi:hypothetical protein
MVRSFVENEVGFRSGGRARCDECRTSFVVDGNAWRCEKKGTEQGSEGDQPVAPTAEVKAP